MVPCLCLILEDFKSVAVKLARFLGYGTRSPLKNLEEVKN
jgi:hypothetical protein